MDSSQTSDSRQSEDPETLTFYSFPCKTNLRLSYTVSNTYNENNITVKHEFLYFCYLKLYIWFFFNRMEDKGKVKDKSSVFFFSLLCFLFCF